MYGLGNILGAVLAPISSAANTRQTNKTNLKIAEMTNANNRQLVAMQNAAAKAESELAYKRSSAGNQVNLLRQAGMSRAGAINALNGGGSYTPAPVNTSQDQGATMQTADLGALANVGQALESIAQRKHEKKMQEKQLAAQKEMQEQQLASSERIAYLNAETTNRNADNRLGLDREIWNKETQVIDKNIEKIVKELEVMDEQKRSIQLDNARKHLENENLPTLLELMNSKTSHEISVMAKQIEKLNAETYGVKLENGMKEIAYEFEKLTKDSRINVTNLVNELTSIITSKDINTLVNSVGADFIHALIFIVKYVSPFIPKVA